MLAEEPAWGKSQLVPQPSLPLCCAETQHSISHRQEKTFKERKKKKKSNKKTKKAREKKEGDSLSVSHAAAAMLTKEQYVAMVLMLT